MTTKTISAIAVLLVALAWNVSPAASDTSADRSPDLDALSRLHQGRSMRASSSDANWQSGNKDSRGISPGEEQIIADLDGPGVIHHIWFTIHSPELQFGRSLTLRMYWDDRTEPAVESPIGDFFAVGNGTRRYVDSLPVSVTSEGRAFNCYWSMPFAKHARITLTNDSPTNKVGVYWYVDYETLPSLPPDTPYFHAQYRQEYPAKLGQNYLLLDTEGAGHYVGTVLSIIQRTKSWFGEGDDFFYIDGEAEPSIRGTGTEDYFCDAWAFREFCRPYYGVVMFEGFDVGDRTSVYRWHIKDPIRFTKSLKVEIEHKGVMFDDKDKLISHFHERADLFSSVAFWYQTGPAKRFASLPPAEERVVPNTTIEMEQYVEAAKTSPADVKVEALQSNLFSSVKLLNVRFADEHAMLTVPFKRPIQNKRAGPVAPGQVQRIRHLVRRPRRASRLFEASISIRRRSPPARSGSICSIWMPASTY